MQNNERLHQDTTNWMKFEKKTKEAGENSYQFELHLVIVLNFAFSISYTLS